MKKDWYKSLTFWGALLLGLTMFLQEMGTIWPWAVSLGQALGAFLGVFGIRRAMK